MNQMLCNIGTHSQRFRYSFICQGTSTRRQWSDLFGLRVKQQANLSAYLHTIP